jgi:hypothetical protein
MASNPSFIPPWLKIWFFFSALIVFFDAFFIINRPLTLKGGPYYNIYYLYDNYTIYDKLYASLTDPFVVIQSWLNVVEGILLLSSLLISIPNSVRYRMWAAIIATLASAFVFWKTVIFIWYDHDWISLEAKSFSPGSLLCYYLPNALWIIFPILAIYLIPKKIIIYAVDTKSKQKRD